MQQISDEDFEKYFRPITEKPQEGEVMARWRACADFVDGCVKRNVIDLLLRNEKGGLLSRKILSKVAKIVDEKKVLIEMSQDLLDGKSIDEVAQKPYPIVIQHFYWAKRENVPDDPHWDIIEYKDLSKF